MDRTPLAFHGGPGGALAPFALFLAGVAWLALSGAPDERGFWPILLAALGFGQLLAVDRHRYAQCVIASIAQPIVALMIMAWLLAGVLGVILSETGLIPGLVWAARASGVTGAWYVGAAFLICAVVSTSTGTSFGTILVAGPLLYPPAGALAAPVVPLLGAILAGSTFGDSISPVSDTSIASAGSQDTDVPGTVRTRLRYVIPAGFLALIASVILAGTTTAPQTATVDTVEGSARALPMLLVPVVVIWLLVRRHHLLEGLFAGIGVAVALALLLKLVTLHELLYIDRAAFAAKGLIIDGLSRAVGVSVFTLLLMGLVGTLQESGIVDGFVHRLSARSREPRAAEVSIVLAMSATVLLTTHSVVSILAVGPLARDVGERAGLHPYRRANLLDMTACTWPFILPYFLPTILTSGVSVSGAAFGLPRVSPWQAGMANTYAWALVLAVTFAVATGYGRTRDHSGTG